MPELLSAQKMAAKKPAQRTPVSRAPMEATSARLANWVAKTTILKGSASSPNRLNPSMKNARSLKGRNRQPGAGRDDDHGGEDERPTGPALDERDLVGANDMDDQRLGNELGRASC